MSLSIQLALDAFFSPWLTSVHKQRVCYFLKHCRFFSLCFDGSSAAHQCGMAPSCETLQFGRLAPQQQGGRDWIDKDISTKRYGFFIASWRQGVLLANAVAATRPQHEPLSIPGELARTFAKYPSQCTSLILFIYFYCIPSLVPLASLLCANVLQKAWQDGMKENTNLDEARSVFVYMAAPIVRAPGVEPSRN